MSGDLNEAFRLAESTGYNLSVWKMADRWTASFDDDAEETEETGTTWGSSFTHEDLYTAIMRASEECLKHKAFR